VWAAPDRCRARLEIVRGYFALAVTGILFLFADLLERTVVVALIRLRPASREQILSRWARALAALTLTVTQRIGGAHIRNLPSIPAGSGILILMNHQSLLDIPLVIRCLESGYPKIVTRRRYFTGIPLVSHMLRLYDHPAVDPRAPSRRQITELIRAARNATQPMVVFPEGTRSRNGEIGPFMKAGLSGILAVRSWAVYLAVGDGFWRSGRIQELGRELPRVRGQVAVDGPHEFRAGDPGVDADSFLDRMRERMCVKLREIREGAAGASIARGA
jgi:1-acyl-sn-glycerol-3-phosphate acyltransferase